MWCLVIYPFFLLPFPLFMGIVTNIFTTFSHSIGITHKLYLFPLVNSYLLSINLAFKKNSVSLNGMLKPIALFKKPTFGFQFLIF